MKILLILAVGLLSFANGANDNFKGVATLWGAGLTTYRRAIAWATGFTLFGSLTAFWLGSARRSRCDCCGILPCEVRCVRQGSHFTALILSDRRISSNGGHSSIG